MNNNQDVETMWGEGDGGSTGSESYKIKYLKSHMPDFAPSEEERRFIDEKLEYDDGVIKIGGWLKFILVVNILSIVGMVISVGMMFAAGHVGLGIIYILLLVLYIMLVYSMLKRKRMAINYFRALQIAGLVLGIFTMTQGADVAVTIGGFVGSAIWISYSFLSKRMKYTLVE